MQEISKKLGQNLKKARTKKKLSQGALARFLEVDKGYTAILKMERKIRRLRQFKSWLTRLVFRLMNY